MMNAEAKKRMTTMKRRKITIAVTALLVAIMAVALVFVLEYTRTTTVIDPADDTEYYIKRDKDKVYALYDTDKKTKRPTDSQYGYYITKAQTLIKVNAETGEYEIRAVLADYSTNADNDNEVVGVNFRRMLFPHIEKANIRSLEVYNETGTYTFARMNASGEYDDNADFVIVGSPQTAYDQELFASLHVSAGYAISTQKLENDKIVRYENGEINYAEYGLVPISDRQRVLEDGTVETYDYSPAYYILTDKSGNKYKVLIGDRLVTGGGYYVQYVDMSNGTEKPTEAIYVFSSTISESLLAPIEDYVTPRISYPMTMNTYLDVEDFMVLKNGTNDKGESEFEEIVSFSSIDLADRENTINISIPYVFNENSESPAAALKGFQPASTNIDTVLRSIYDPSFVGVHKFSPKDEDFVECGIWKLVVDENGEPVLDANGKKQYDISAEYSISFKYDALDSNGNFVETVQSILFISAPNENGNRYVFTSIYSPATDDRDAKYLYDYNMIVEVAEHSLSFLSWDHYDWINRNYVSFYISFIESIKLESPEYSAEFKLDNSLSNKEVLTDSSLLTIMGTDSLGHNVNTFAQKTVTDTQGRIWVITATDIKVYNSMGTELKITSGKYEYNKLGTQAFVYTNGINATNGDVIYVEADQIKITHPNGATEQICRYDSMLFRQFYRTLMYSTIVDSYPIDDEKREEIVSGTPLLTMTIKTSDGQEYVYRFYHLTSRKAYITINGNGSFYVLPTRVQKFIDDAQRFFNLELIDAEDKF